MLNSSLELKIRIVRGEVEVNQREKEKCLTALGGLIACFISLIVGSIYFFVIKKEYEFWHTFFVGFLGLFILFLGYYWYHRYKKAKQKVEQLEKELARLKKEMVSDTGLK